MRRTLGVACVVVSAWAGSVIAAEPNAKTLKWTADEGVGGKSIQVPSQGDGLVDGIEAGGRKALRNRPKSNYIYFDLPEDFKPSTAFVMVEYWDEGLGVLSLQYDSNAGEERSIALSYRPAEQSHGALLLDSRGWRTAVFELMRPAFRNHQNYHSDFRLATQGRIAIASVTVSDAPPPKNQLEAIKASSSPDKLKPLASVGAGVESTIGGLDNYDITQTANWKSALQQHLPVLKAIGATSHETYVVWRCCEAEQGKWDFSHYDACVDAHVEAKLKWVPFLILGSAYSLPDWYYKSAERFGYRCLEHDQVSDIQSLWDPKLPGRVEAFIRAFAKQYKDRNVIESVLLGITGNYGEAIYPASGNDWTASVHGQYHTHGGMWCGDAYARKDFSQWLEKKYGTIDKLNRAWGASHKQWDQVQPIANEKKGRPRAWLDTVDWYRASMNRWIELWMASAAKEMPGIPVYLCTGGHAPPEHGAEFGIQSKLAAKYRGGVRITNEGSNFAVNFAHTRWVGSACRFYGTFFGYEPASGVDPKGIAARIFNASASGAKQLHHYSNNILGQPESIEKWRTYAHLMQLRKPKIDVAVWYPNRMVDLRRGNVWSRLQQMREVCDYDIVDDQMIRDGALDRYQILVCISDGPYEKEIIERVAAWLSPQKVLYMPRGNDFAITTVEGEKPLAEQWPLLPGVKTILSNAKLDGYFPALQRDIVQYGVLVTNIPQVYAATFEDGSVLLLNMTDAPQRLVVKGQPVAIPPGGLAEVK